MVWCIFENFETLSLYFRDIFSGFIYILTIADFFNFILMGSYLVSNSILINLFKFCSLSLDLRKLMGYLSLEKTLGPYCDFNFLLYSAMQHPMLLILIFYKGLTSPL